MRPPSRTKAVLVLAVVLTAGLLLGLALLKSGGGSSAEFDLSKTLDEGIYCKDVLPPMKWWSVYSANFNEEAGCPEANFTAVYLSLIHI